MNITYDKLFKLIKENLLVILAGGILCFGIAFSYSKFYVNPVYYSDAKIIIDSEKNSEIKTAADLTLARSIVDTYIEILNSNDFYKQVHSSLPDDIKPQYTPSTLKDNATLSVVRNTEVIQVSFKCLDKKHTQLITSKIVDNIGTYFNLTSKYQTYVNVTDSAHEALVSQVDITRYSVLGFILGIALVIIIVVLRDLFDTRVKTTKDIRERYNLPVLGAIPTFNGKKIKKESGYNGQ